MPKPTELPETLTEFAFRNAASIDSGRNFDTDIERLMRSMDGLLQEQEQIRAEEQSKIQKKQAEADDRDNDRQRPFFISGAY